jgi:hypothetical protein
MPDIEQHGCYRAKNNQDLFQALINSIENAESVLRKYENQ